MTADDRVMATTSASARSVHSKKCRSRARRSNRLDSIDRLVDQLIESLTGKTSTIQRRRSAAEKRRQPKGLSTAALCREYLKFADSYYFQTDTGNARETVNIDFALRPLRKLYGRLPAAELGPLKIKSVRDIMIEKGWCRRQINHQVGRIKRMLKWATENELIPPSVFHAIQPIAGLRYGRSKAVESEPVRPVAQELVDGVVQIVSSPVKAMIELQLLTGMRPGEVVIMRSIDIDRSCAPWAYRPLRHKTAHHGHERHIFLGPKCQLLIQPFLTSRPPEAFLFSPADAEAERRARQHASRKTPLSCGNRPGSNVKRKPKKKPRDRYDTNSYAGAIAYACKKASPVPHDLSIEQRLKWERNHHWHPHQLRHNAATRIRKEFGLEVAQVVLGHQTLAVTQVYAERDIESAQRVMTAAG